MTKATSQNMPRVPVITIDGPSGTGKGTISRVIRNWLGWHFLDSGALYRALGLAVLRYGMNISDTHKIASMASKIDVSFAEVDGETKVFQDGSDCTSAIRTEECGITASRLAVFPHIRKALLKRQHDFRVRPGLVADGRDMGTVVFPDADLQIFMNATVEERARRRHNQLKKKEIYASLAGLSKDIAERDERDITRKESPLKPSSRAIILDTTDLSVARVTRKVKDLVRERGLV